GICHVYIDAAADPEMALQIVVNSKCQRRGVCNACESLLVHESLADTWLPRMAEQFAQRGVEMRGDPATCRLVPKAVAATPQDWSTEYLGPTISCRVVPDIDTAIAHIESHGSGHTDAIVTSDLS